MNKKKNWNIPINYEKEPSKKIVSKHKKRRVPVFVRITISLIIYCIVYTILSYSFPKVAEYINHIASIFLAGIGFIITSYKDYKNKLYNEIIYGRKEDK